MYLLAPTYEVERRRINHIGEAVNRKERVKKLMLVVI